MSKEQCCPMCGIKVEPSQRYPNYICKDCVSEAQSQDGRKLEFYNTDLGGGCRAEYVDTKEEYEHDVFYIKRIKCYAQEAHFGGIVVRSVNQLV
jgi:hypothetical protein